MDTAKGHMENLKLEAEEILKEHIIMQIVESVTEKSAQVKTCAEDISGRFQKFEKYFRDANTVWVALRDPHVSVGGLLQQDILGENFKE